MADTVDKIENVLILTVLACLGIGVVWLVAAAKGFTISGLTDPAQSLKDFFNSLWSTQNDDSGAVPDYNPTLADQAAQAEQSFEAGSDPTQLIPSQDDNQTFGGLISAIPGQLASDPGQFLADNGIF